MCQITGIVNHFDVLLLFYGEDMTIDDVYNHYKSGRQMQIKTGLSHSNFQNWRERGYIPIATQMKIERLTDGALKADLSHCKKEEELPNAHKS